MSVVLTCFFLIRRYGSSAAPISIFTPETPELQLFDSPIFERDDFTSPGRSIWDIVWSCLATTFAVTWVSVHPNIPWLEENKWSILRRRVFLMCLALLAPEVMIMWAFKQWRGALMIRECINGARPRSCRPWTMAHAHFLQMGGFKLCTTKRKDNYWAADWYDYRVTRNDMRVWEGVLLFDDFRKLLANGTIDFPDVNEDEISDRSKGDALSKGVALLQITWFIIQLIARACQHLTITEIELTTAALAGLNSIMYLCWWNKPLDVRYPIVIRTKELDNQLAESAMAKEKQEGEWAFPIGSNGHPIDFDFRLTDHLWSSARGSAERVAFHLVAWLNWHRLFNGLRSSFFVCQSKSEAPDSGTIPKATHENHTHPVRRTFSWAWSSFRFLISTLLYLPHLFMFSPLDKILRPFWGVSLEEFSDARDKMHRKSYLKMLFNENDMKWIMSMIFHGETAELSPLLNFSAFAGVVFGSVHCAAWNFDFPSHVEQVFWRTASLSIVGVCLSVIAGSSLHRFVLLKWRQSSKESYWAVALKTLEIGPAAIYTLARISLLILALLSLRLLSDSALETVTWTKFIPHI